MKTKYRNYNHYMYRISGIDISGYEISENKGSSYWNMDLFINNECRFVITCEKEQMEKISDFILKKIENCECFYVTDMPGVEDGNFICTKK